MDRDKNNARPISAHRLPVSLGTPMPRPSLAASRPAAAFLAQLLATRENLPDQRKSGRTVGSEASGAYRRTESIDVKRMPMGWRKSLSA